MLHKNLSVSNHRFSLLTTLGGMLLYAGSAAAASFNVNPVRVEMFNGHTTSVVQIQNLADDAVTVQAHVMAWSQKDGEEVMTETDDVLLNPPIFTIQPKSSQFLRLGLRQPKILSDGELSYRLILEEVPKPPKPGFAGLQTVLRISLPIFAKTQQRVAAPLSWSAAETADGELHITAINQGNTHVQVQHLEIARSETPDSSVVAPPRPYYVLPGQTHTWIFRDAHLQTSHSFQLTAKTDAGDVHEHLATTTH